MGISQKNPPGKLKTSGSTVSVWPWLKIFTKRRFLVLLSLVGIIGISTSFMQIYQLVDSTKHIKFIGETDEPCTEEFKTSHLMKTEEIMGRLANQLFALSGLIAAADYYCYTAVIPPKEFLDVLSIFHVHNLVATEYKVLPFQRQVKEKGPSIYEGPVLQGRTLKVNYTIGGLRQSYKYFKNKSDLVRSSFIFKGKIISDVWDYFANNSLVRKTRVGVHVRRGDFLAYPSSLGFHVSTVDYIIKAMEYFKSFKDVVFIVVSEDMQWCRENLHFPNIYFSPFGDVGRDFCIATQCNHNIITTGTFSWFGAWLNETGIVIYDKLYPEPNSSVRKGHRDEDYYPDWWIGM